ncbi:MAG: geranylgeranyl diphosphate synthase type II [Sphingobacteriales bacterium]|jgi:geranylgeranyl diphosphate synthase type II
MYSFGELREIILKEIEDFKPSGKPSELFDPINYIMRLGGKRMRPASVLMGCNVFSDDISEALKPALSVEVFHNFTLVHDDIMDKAPLRRNMPTVHEKWNNDIAILSGDVMMIYAYELLKELPTELLKPCMDVFNRTAIGVCQGQQLDMNFETKDKVTEEEYIEMISLKTAVLLAGSLKIGALIGGASTEDADHLYNFGFKLGTAFQVQDDILDIYANQADFGKQVGGDIISNKKTLLLITALNNADSAQRKSLDTWIAKTDFNSEEKVKAITTLYNEMGIRDAATQHMERLTDEALNELEQISAPQARKAVLKDFSRMLMKRVK